VWLKPNGVDPLCVWIHPIGGGVDCYRPLTAELPFKALGIDALAAPAESAVAYTVETIAARYLAALGEQRLQAPLILGGWSFGGLIAYAMGTHLRRREIRTPPVILIDSYLFDSGDDLSLLMSQDVFPDELRDLGSVDAERMRTLLQSNCSAASSYRPESYEGRVLSLRASQMSGDPDGRWLRTVKQLSIESVDGDHYSILEPPALGLARTIRQWISTAGA
jgi:thioesterase domain-containing protein